MAARAGAPGKRQPFRLWRPGIKDWLRGAAVNDKTQISLQLGIGAARMLCYAEVCWQAMGLELLNGAVVVQETS